VRWTDIDDERLLHLRQFVIRITNVLEPDI